VVWCGVVWCGVVVWLVVEVGLNEPHDARLFMSSEG
jgi:hypothetical protein